ncbi:DUF4340 domain-containing protein [Hirschia litorea]|uniref:DUF4340 domain-containing protein n=1 Tax=Hirschia litorea TaxID=1199156 RepID=A0ABW2IM36_9PROT
MAKAKKRSRLLWGCSALAVLSFATAFISGMDKHTRKQAGLVGKVVLPEFEADVTAADDISVTTKEGTYHLTRDGRDWFLSERGRYPIQLTAIANLSEALASMTFTRQMTVDPKKFDRLGLGDPLEGGTGALMQVKDADGNTLVNMVVGFKNGSAYIRKPDEMQTWAVDASIFPPLQTPARWLDLDILEIGAEDIARVQVEFKDGRSSYGLKVRGDAPGQFELTEPYEDALLIASFAPNPPALALSRLVPLDVAPRSEIKGRLRAIHRTITHQGWVIEVELIEDKGKYWAVFSQGLEVEREEISDQIDELEDKVAGWAFEISNMDFNIMTTALNDIAVIK